MAEESVMSGVDYNKPLEIDPQPKAEVPEWLPPKFVDKEGKPNYQALAQSYQELEKARSKPQVPPKGPDGKFTKPAEVAPSAPSETSNVWSEENLNRWSQEAAANGGFLNEESYAQIPVPRPLVDLWIQNMTQKVQGEANQDIEYFGGQDGWKEVQGWASANYSQEQKDAFHQALRVGGPVKKMALENLKNHYESEVGKPAGRRVAGDLPTAGNAAPFANWNEVRSAMSDPRYRQGTAGYDAAYADMVRRRTMAMK